jgi:hypothetical protein
MADSLRFGITESGVLHTSADAPLDLDIKFRMVKESGVYDYFDKTPPADQEANYRRCIEKYELPMLAGSWFYTLGRDEGLLEENLRLGGRLGSRVHNTQIMMDHADGRLVTDQEVAQTYLRAYDVGAGAGCMPTLEVHVNMWSEDFRRIAVVGDLVERRGVPFRMTLDHSHVIFKIDNPREQAVFGIDQAVASGELVLDPFKAGNVCDLWIGRGFVGHAHARPAIPNNPRNIWGRHASLDKLPSSLHPQDLTGRGIQYPFIAPKPGEYHSPWDGSKLEPWKEVVRHLFAWHAASADSALTTISTEMIPAADYGEGGKYSIFEHSVACARWLRQAWAEAQAAAGTSAAAE